MVGSRRNAAAHCRRNLGGAAALGSPYGRAGEPAASLRGRMQLQIWEKCGDCCMVPSQSRLRRASSPKGRAKGRALPAQRSEITAQ